MKNKTNRFEVLSSTRRGKVLIFSILIILLPLSIEILSYVTALAYFKYKGRPLNLANNQFLIGRPFASNPVKENTKARYVGHLGQFKSIREWHIADPVLGWRLGKNVGVTLHHGDGEDLGWQITNDQGFAAAESIEFNVALEKPSGTYRIFILGGSTVEGLGAQIPQDNLPAQFSRLLKKMIKFPSGYSNFEVVNAGVSGYNSANEFLYFATELKSYDPDLVIFYNGWNDQVYWQMELENDPNQFFPKRLSKHKRWAQRLNETYTFSGTLKHLLENVKRTFYELSFKITTIWILKSLIVGSTRDAPLHAANNNIGLSENMENSPYPTKATMFYKQNIRDGIKVATSNGIKVATFLQPLVGIDDKPKMGIESTWAKKNPLDIKYRQLFYNSTREMLRELSQSYTETSQACVADLSGSFKNNTELLYSDGSGHLNRKGNALMAQSMLNALAKCGMFTRETKQSISPPAIKDISNNNEE